MSQTSQHLIREGDTALIENAQHRMFFSADGSLTDFQERLRLRDQDMRLELSSEEYWRELADAGFAVSDLLQELEIDPETDQEIKAQVRRLEELERQSRELPINLPRGFGRRLSSQS